MGDEKSDEALVTEGPDEFVAEPELTREERIARLMAEAKELQEEVGEPTEPYRLFLMLRNGKEQTFEVTSFEPMIVHGRIVEAKWSQNHAVPGEELLQFVDWSEVVLVSVASIEPVRNANRRR